MSDVPEMTEEEKRIIDSLTRVQMAQLWRFAPFGTAILQGKAGDYFAERFKQLGGFSTEISKSIGWGE